MARRAVPSAVGTGVLSARPLAPVVFRPSDPTRALSVLATAAGLVHLLAPRSLLAVAARAYECLLGVDFEPRERAPRRVRAVGALLLAVGIALWRRP